MLPRRPPPLIQNADDDLDDELPLSRPESVTPEQWDRMLDLNMLGKRHRTPEEEKEYQELLKLMHAPEPPKPPEPEDPSADEIADSLRGKTAAEAEAVLAALGPFAHVGEPIDAVVLCEKHRKAASRLLHAIHHPQTDERASDTRASYLAKPEAVRLLETAYERTLQTLHGVRQRIHACEAMAVKIYGFKEPTPPASKRPPARRPRRDLW